MTTAEVAVLFWMDDGGHAMPGGNVTQLLKTADALRRAGCRVMTMSARSVCAVDSHPHVFQTTHWHSTSDLLEHVVEHDQIVACATATARTDGANPALKCRSRHLPHRPAMEAIGCPGKPLVPADRPPASAYIRSPRLRRFLASISVPAIANTPPHTYRRMHLMGAPWRRRTLRDSPAPDPP